MLNQYMMSNKDIPVRDRADSGVSITSDTPLPMQSLQPAPAPLPAAPSSGLQPPELNPPKV